MKLSEYVRIESAADLSRSEVGRLGSAIIFIVAVMIYAGTHFSHVEQMPLLVAAAVIGAYMAMNIGANDVANNVGPAVGSLAMTMTMAILIAAVFEAGGAIIAGGEVVQTVKKGIIDPNDIDDTNTFVWVMMGALLGAAISLRDREHIRVEYFVELLPPRLRRSVELATLVGVLLFYLAMLLLGFMWVHQTSGTSTSALKWPLNWFFYAALPTSAVLGAWYSLRRLKRGQYAELDTAADESGRLRGDAD